MTIGCIISIIIGGLVLIGGVALGIFGCVDGEVGTGVAVMIISFILSATLITVPIIYSNTEAGKRALKDQKSNFGAGIEREVRVYDVSGELIEKYSGKFDVETTSEYIIFDDENDKRHMIYYTTGTVIIDEK